VSDADSYQDTDCGGLAKIQKNYRDFAGKIPAILLLLAASERLLVTIFGLRVARACVCNHQNITRN
jgi:hypothetical protein